MSIEKLILLHLGHFYNIAKGKMRNMWEHDMNKSQTYAGHLLPILCNNNNQW